MSASPADVARKLVDVVRRQQEENVGYGALLERYIAHQAGDAFAALVRRHGPMVWGVCRRMLRCSHDAADAFQAAFLVLARKAGSVMPRERVGNWLYGVAQRTALRARATAARRELREKTVDPWPE